MTEAYRLSDQNRGPQLRNGDQMKQAIFHAQYEQMPEAFRAELLDGTVFVAMPLGHPHANGHACLTTIFGTYIADTPGTEILLEATTILGEDDEVQPDLLLRVLPEFGGRTRTNYAQYIEGPPELICEVAYSSRSIDLHLKRKRYLSAGVLEYVVLCLDPGEIRWFDFVNREMIQPDSQGTYRSRIFPGLWLAEEALLNSDYASALEILHHGIATLEHSELVERLRQSKL
jgi:Uma2 family endonuclease